MSLEFLTAPENTAFGVAIIVITGLALLEGLGSLIGLGLSSLVDSILPDFDFDFDFDVDADLDLDMDMDMDMDIDVDADIDVGAGGGLGLDKFLAWLHFGKVPISILLFLFLCSFGISGYVVQAVMLNTFGSLLPGALAVILAFFASLPCLHLSAQVVERYMPKDETDAVSEDTFIGRKAHLVLGTARKGKAAQAKLKDENGNTHYIMVEPQQEGIEFAEGEEVEITEKNGAFFHAKKAKEQAAVKVKKNKEILIET